MFYSDELWPIFKAPLQDLMGAYSALYTAIEENDGWPPFPEKLQAEFAALGITHWAECHCSDTPPPFVSDVVSAVTPTPIDLVQSYLANDGDMQAAILDAIKKLPAELSAQVAESAGDGASVGQTRDFWTAYLAEFYNDLSMATFREPLRELVARVRDEFDKEALAKAIQIDRTLRVYFEPIYANRALAGDGDFFAALGERDKNPPLCGGAATHPLLNIFFYKLEQFAFPLSGMTGKDLLAKYVECIGEASPYVIEDEATVRRQRTAYFEVKSRQ